MQDGSDWNWGACERNQVNTSSEKEARVIGMKGASSADEQDSDRKRG
jgi:hypothetical protein